ncbi:GlyGly-CTERM sorting domain-containing protein [Acinetobacter pittii]|nr:GlyGly-CTERM sorting domain-containing protein [Acinetobacter pittii]
MINGSLKNIRPLIGLRRKNKTWYLIKLRYILFLDVISLGIYSILFLGCCWFRRKEM